MLTVVVIAKECVPGRVKTRLTPALSAEQAARVAFGALTDTLETVRQLPADRFVLAFDGDARNAPAEADGFDIVPQASGGLDSRLAAIFDEGSGPTLLVGMDTPQLTPAHLEYAIDGMRRTETVQHAAEGGPGRPSAWLGLANDGGFWALAMSRPEGSVIRGVPMSQGDTGATQLARLQSTGFRVSLLPQLTDIDTFADAVEVAAAAPHSHFARAFASAVQPSSAAGAAHLAARS